MLSPSGRVNKKRTSGTFVLILIIQFVTEAQTGGKAIKIYPTGKMWEEFFCDALVRQYENVLM
jgi:hypothetical protein